MKLVKEYINEKFIEDSDPIKDMGIGMMHKIIEYYEKIVQKKFSENRNTYAGSSIGYDGLLIFLAQTNKYEYAKYLIESGKITNFRDNYSLALRWASARGNIKLIKLLIAHGADPNDSNAGNSLDCAITHNQLRAIKYLIKIGAKVTDTTLRYAKQQIKNSNFPQEILDKLELMYRK